MDAKATLTALRGADVTRVPLDEITADEALQPRVPEAVRYGHRRTTCKLSEQHTITLLRRLEGDAREDLDPILLARAETGLLVVDGFHRLRAYELAERNTIPARVYPMTRKMAAMVAKLANLDQRALDLHPDQRREAVWQWMVVSTDGSGEDLPMSQRKIAAETGVARDTIASMLKHMSRAARREWPPEDCHPVTGFVRWDVVKRDLLARFADTDSDDDEDDPVSKHIRREAEQFADKLVTLCANTTPEARKLGLSWAIRSMDETTYDDNDKAALAMLRQARRGLAEYDGDDDTDADF